MELSVISRELQCSEMEDIAKIMRVATKRPLQDHLIVKHLEFHEKIMLHRESRFTRGTHFRRYVETAEFGNKRFYVRMGKRGQCKRYLESCDITFVNGEATLFEYRTERANEP
jgi:hypothetical protein